jgi:hypothetical protein
MSKQSKGRREETKPVWDALAGLSAAVSQVTQVTAILIPFLRDKDLMQKIADQAKFTRLATTLDRDVRQMTMRYRTISDKHAGRTGGTTNQTEWMSSIDLSEQYVAWAADFDAVVIPTFLDMVSMLTAAGADTSAITAPSATSLAQQSNVQ